MSAVARDRVVAKPFDQIIADFLLAEVPVGSRVIDVGCGTGWTAILLTDHQICSSCEGVDVDELDIHRANRWFLKAKRDHLVHCQQCSAEELTKKLGRSNYDVVVSNHSLHHYLSPERGLREIYHILKAGGVLLLTELEQKFGETIDNCPRFRPDKIKQLIEGAGFPVDTFEQKKPGVLLVKARK